MTDDAAFLKAILEDPFDDTIRLIYADFLEGRGDGARAEFIRLQIETPRLEHLLDGCWCDDGRNLPECEKCAANRQKFNDGRRREHEIIYDHDAWRCGEDRWYQWAGAAVVAVPDGAPFYDHLSFSRGFVSSISLPTQAFLDHAAALFAAAPIEEVRLTDRDSAEGRYSGIRWMETEGVQPAVFTLPSVLWWRLKYGRVQVDAFTSTLGGDPRRWRVYDAVGESGADLSQAAVSHGRALANLPPLRPPHGRRPA